MKATLFFVGLQYILGFAFAMTGVFIVGDFGAHMSLGMSIIVSFLKGYTAMLVGVWLVGYFHLRLKHAVNKLAVAMALSFLGLSLFFLIYILVSRIVEDELGILMWLLPLTGAVF